MTLVDELIAGIQTLHKRCVEAVERADAEEAARRQTTRELEGTRRALRRAEDANRRMEKWSADEMQRLTARIAQLESALQTTEAALQECRGQYEQLQRRVQTVMAGVDGTLLALGGVPDDR